MIWFLAGLILGVVIGSVLERRFRLDPSVPDLPVLTGLYDEVSSPTNQALVRDSSGKLRIVELTDPNPNTPRYDR